MLRDCARSGSSNCPFGKKYVLVPCNTEACRSFCPPDWTIAGTDDDAEDVGCYKVRVLLKSKINLLLLDCSCRKLIVTSRCANKFAFFFSFSNSCRKRAKKIPHASWRNQSLTVYFSVVFFSKKFPRCRRVLQWKQLDVSLQQEQQNTRRSTRSNGWRSNCLYR